MDHVGVDDPLELAQRVGQELGDLRRRYSLCCARTNRDEWTIGVLHEPAGRGGSAHLHQRVCVGDLITVTGLRNLFALAPAPEYLFVAGDIGITPNSR